MVRRLRLWIAVILVAVAAAAFWLAGEREVRNDRPAVSTAQAAARKPRPAEPGPPQAGPPSSPAESKPAAGASEPVVVPASPARIFAGPLTRSIDEAPKTPPAPAPTPAVRRPPPAGEDPAKTEADLLARNIRDFGQRFGGNPTGTNAEIVKALNGGNSGRASYLPSEVRRLNDQGELLDRWGTPYFFHQMSADHMEVRSAGPDKQLWTPDDVVTR